MNIARLIALAVCLALLPLSVLAAGPTITLSPTPLEVKIGQTVPLAVRINNVEGLYGFDVRLKFDPSIVEVQDANPQTPALEMLPGEFLSYDLAPKNEADNAAGTAWIAVAQVNPHEAKNGSGTLFTLYVKGKAAGKTAVEITEATLANRDGERILATWTDAQVQVDAASAAAAMSPTPLPTAPAPRIDLTAAAEQQLQTPVAAGAIATTPPTSAAPADAGPIGAAPALVSDTATQPPVETAASRATVAVPPPASNVQPAITTASPAATVSADDIASPLPVEIAAAAAKSMPQPVATPARAAAQNDQATVIVTAAAPAARNAPTRIDYESATGNDNTLFFVGGGLLLLVAIGATSFSLLRRGR